MGLEATEPRTPGVLARLFPERRIYYKTRDGVACATRGPATQALMAVALIALVCWSAYAAVERLGPPHPQAQAAVPAPTPTAAQPDTALLEARVREYERLYDEMVEQLAGKSAQLRDLASNEAVLEERLRHTETLAVSLQQALDAKLQGEAQTLVEAETRLHHAAGETAALQADLAASQSAERRLGETLMAISARLAATSAQRDDAARTLNDLRVELAETRANLDMTRARSEQVLSRLEQAARASMSDLETALSRSGVDVDGLLDEIAQAYGGSGGPFTPLGPLATAPEEYAIPHSRASDLIGRLERVNLLRLAVDKLPLDRPIRANHRRSSRFGPRRDPVNRRRAMHNGLDLSAPRGTPVFSTAGGRVAFAGRMRGYGKVIRIDHGFGFQTTYAHLSRIHVTRGQQIDRRDHIGDVGNTGRSTGNHLHYEVRRHGAPIDPEKFIEAGRHVF